MLTAGIVGLPNVGKSTLFNAITNSQVEAANYPFATIEPNKGVVEVRDPRITTICEMVQPQKTIYTTFEFIDIAGLVKGASKGEGLGNKFLSNIRETDAIIHMVRCFEDDNITHVENHVDPIRDIEIINLELILSDLSQVENRIGKIAKKVKSGDKSAQFELQLLEKIATILTNNQRLSTHTFTPEEEKCLQSWNLLTKKPMIYVCNLAEADIHNYQNHPFFQVVLQHGAAEGAPVIPVSAQIEAELAQMETDERQLFLQELGFTESGLDRLVKTAYHTLNLRTFFTVGKVEVRAWTFTQGMKAPQCAGVIHSDFEKGFIRAETYAFEDLLQYRSEAALKEAGKLRLEGKEYVVQDGDILHFRFNV